MNRNQDNPQLMQAVFFDLFETLITETTRPDFQLRPPYHYALKTSPEKLAKWWKENGQASLTGAKYRDCEAALRSLCAEICSPLTDDEIAAVAAEHEQWKLNVLSTVDARSLELVRSLRAMGLKVAVISNILPEERLAWNSCPLRYIVDDAIFSCDVGLMKPQIEIYKLACDRLDVQPINACFIGDGSFEELQGAMLAGLTPIHAVWYQNQAIDWPIEYGDLQRSQTMDDVLTLIKSLI